MEPGTVLGTYQIERLLGRGGMGAVFLAHDNTLHRPVALKIVEESEGRGSARDRLLREARTAAALNHPNICTIHEVGEAGACAFIAMEFVEGRALRDRLDEGTLSYDEAVRLGIQAAEALAFAHERGVIHRDFKAANAMVTPDGRLKVVDFGLARREDALATGASTIATIVPAGAAAGTPYAMAPEQIRGAPVDARTDIWALGVLLYEMVSGTRPFNAATIPDLFSAILTTRPAPLPAEVPAGIQAVVERCLEKAPEHRYQQASEVREALQAVAAGTVSARIAWRYYLRRRRGLLAATVCVALSALLGLNVGGARDWFAGTAPLAPAIKLAVLPFQNLTGDPEQEYFSDGLTDEMITQLGRLHPQRLSVIARTSSMRYKNVATAIVDVARELGVDYVLEGSARREGTRIRVTARLIQVSDHTQRWTDSFDRELASILSLQNDVARGVAASLALTLLPAERARLAQAPQLNPKAYEAYLQGQNHLRRVTRGDLDRAQEYFELALQLDPNYALAHHGIGAVWAGRRAVGFVGFAEGVAASRAALSKALALDPALPQRHLALANAHFWQDWNWAAAEPEYRQAIELLPNDADARVFYARYLNVMKRPEEAAAQFQRALELDPLSELVRAMYGSSLMRARRYDDVIANAQAILKTTPASPQALSQISSALHFQGKYDEAMSIEKEMVLTRGDRAAAAAVDRGYAEGGYRGAMRQLADTIATRPFGRGRVAALYVRSGETELALDALERSFESRDNGMVEIGVAGIYEDVRDHPRFVALLRRMNLPQ